MHLQKMKTTTIGEIGTEGGADDNTPEVVRGATWPEKIVAIMKLEEKNWHRWWDSPRKDHTYRLYTALA